MAFDGDGRRGVNLSSEPSFWSNTSCCWRGLEYVFWRDPDLAGNIGKASTCLRTMLLANNAHAHIAQHNRILLRAVVLTMIDSLSHWSFIKQSRISKQSSPTPIHYWHFFRINGSMKFFLESDAIFPSKIISTRQTRLSNTGSIYHYDNTKFIEAKSHSRHSCRSKNSRFRDSQAGSTRGRLSCTHGTSTRLLLYQVPGTRYHSTWYCLILTTNA